jgi:GNAT superfamily N-acetyltransferase
VITVRPAHEATWDDVMAVLGAVKCHGDKCYCQRFTIPNRRWRAVGDAERADMLRDQIEADPTGGLVAYLGDEPVGWCSVRPRTTYPNLLTSRVPWPGRNENKADDSVWTVACLITRPGYRRRGISGELVKAAVDFARAHGARALEGYAMVTLPGQDIAWGELHVGSVGTYADAGFVEVSRPSKRRVVMRLDLASGTPRSRG